MSTLTTLGILDIIYWPFGMLMKGIYSLVGNYGIAIIIFGIIVKLILLPFAFSNEKTRLRNMRIQPKMREIQQRYKGDTRNPKYQEEMQKLYSEENYNPMKGCLPQLIQFPIIFAVFNAIRRPMLYIYGFSSTTIMVIAQKLFEMDESVRNVFGNAIEKITETTAGYHEVLLSGAMKNHFSEIIPKLQESTNFVSAYPEYAADTSKFIETNFLGMDLSVTPTWGWNWTIIIPILSALTSLLISIISMRLNRDPSGEKQPGMGMMKGLMLFMPLFSLWVGFQYTTGVGMYWIISNLLAGIQQVALFYLFKHRREKAEAKLKAQTGTKEKKLNYNQIEKMQREQAEAERLAAEQAKKEKKNK